MHIGSNLGLMPRKVIGFNGATKTIYKPNEYQEILINKWELMLKDVKHPDYVIVNGDITDGTNDSERGLGLWTADVNLQKAVAAELLNEIKCDKYLITKGTKYHTNSNPDADRDIANLLASMGNKVVYGIHVSLSLNDIDRNIYARHKIGSSKWLARPLQAEMFDMELMKDQYGEFDIVAFGHRHEYISVHRVRAKPYWGFILPAFQLQTEYAASHTVRWVPDIGYIRVILTKRDIEVDVQAETINIIPTIASW